MHKQSYSAGSVVFGNWIIAHKIGEGSFGKVYEIRREDFGQTYKAALKVITVPQDEAEFRNAVEEGMDITSAKNYFYSVVQEIVKEFALMSRLKGTTNIVSYEDHSVVQHTSGIGWDILIRMELLTPLLPYAYEHPFSRRDIIKLGIDMCKALELCQKYNIIHRDIKPENIFVSENGDFKLGDFGIARTVEKTLSELSKKGTYNYMAPEVYKGEEYGFSVDIYSLGIVLYRLLNKNRIPFLPPAPNAITYSDREKSLSLRMSGEVIPLPFYSQGRLAEITAKAIAYNKKDRFSSPMQMRAELEAILYDEVDAQVIYPDGDDLEIVKNIYALSSKSESVESDSATNYIFADTADVQNHTSGTESVFNISGAAVVNETVQTSGTVGVFDNVKPAPVIKKEKSSPKNKKTILITILSILGMVIIASGIFIWLQIQEENKQQEFNDLVSDASKLYASDPQKSGELLLQAQELYPEEIEPYVGYAYSLYSAMLYDDCISYIENDLAMGKNYDIETQSRLSEILGAAYFEKDDYAAAASFFRLSTAGGDITVSAMRDYAVSLGKLGDITAAQEVLDSMFDAGADELVTRYVSAEVLYAQKSYIEAESEFLQVLNESQDIDLQRRAMRSVAELYRDCAVDEKLGNSPITGAAKKQVEVIEQYMSELGFDSDPTIWEMLALAYFDAYQMNPELGSEYLQNAANGFETVLSMGIVKDYFYSNLFNIYFQLGDYVQAEEILQNMQTEFPNDYTPYALRSMMLINIENDKDEDQRDFTQAYDEYITASNKVASGDDTTYLLQVESLITELQTNGWL